ncbi:MAG: hypothetical protein SVT52_00200, partial [Planctomycetota bacterium]|nr:hypothetical protein [Planctomycetota bacterium]
MGTRAFKLGLAVVVLTGLGCEPACGPIVLQPGATRRVVDYSDLAEVLQKVVDVDGRLLPEMMAEQADKLDKQLCRLVVLGPTGTPDLFTEPEDAIAYWYNARAAWSMKLAMLNDFPEKLSPRQLQVRTFPLDGRRMTIAEIDTELAADEDWRTVVAAPGVCLSCARLPACPFSGQDIRQRIVERFNEFVDDKERFVIDIRHRRILLPSALWQRRRELVARHNAAYGTTDAKL